MRPTTHRIRNYVSFSVFVIFPDATVHDKYTLHHLHYFSSWTTFRWTFIFPARVIVYHWLLPTSTIYCLLFPANIAYRQCFCSKYCLLLTFFYRVQFTTNNVFWLVLFTTNVFPVNTVYRKCFSGKNCLLPSFLKEYCCHRCFCFLATIGFSSSFCSIAIGIPSNMSNKLDWWYICFILRKGLKISFVIIYPIDSNNQLADMIPSRNLGLMTLIVRLSHNTYAPPWEGVSVRETIWLH